MMSTRLARSSRRTSAALAAVALLALAPAARAQLLDYVGECVPFARAASGIRLYGDAWRWWDAAEGRYARGFTPRPGAVIVFDRTARLPLGHVAVVSRLVDRRVILVTHANWSRQNGARGHAERDVTLTDVSPDNDWSSVRLWYQASDGLGASRYPIRGFVYGTPAARDVAPARPSPELSGTAPDYVGALIDAYR